ncbi:MAG: hypothetical protein HC768_21375 [Acaryochloris sp. CRU_2_0]|nr:hypothetical protein [Acaryochloris sp. CRU_2_0]
MQDLFIKAGGGLYLPEQTAFQQRQSGLLLPKRKYDQPIAIDLFCGCGGFGLGMIEGGFQVVAAVDQDPAAALTYLTNLGAYPVNIQFVDDIDREKFTKVLEREFHCDQDGGNSKVFYLARIVPLIALVLSIFG